MLLLKIVLVEDEFYIRETLKRVIDWKTEGCEIVDEAASGKQAIDKIRKQHPDLILLDINLPDINGFEVIERLKQEGEKAKIIIITGYDTFEFAKKAISYGVTDYILKPVMAAELINVIRRVSARTREEKKEKMAFQQLTDDICRLIPLVDAETLKNNQQLAPEQESKHGLIRKIKQFVEENIGNEELNVDYVSKKLFLNTSYLSHVFKKETEQGLREYIYALRMNHAYDIAVNSEKGLEEIAEEVGYKDAAYFGKCFKKYYGVSISNIRKIQNKYKK